MTSAAKLTGRVTVQLEDRNGKVLKGETKTNAITDPFLYNMLSGTTSLDPLAKILQGKDKSTLADPNRGQYYKQIDLGSWGIYCMKSAVPVTKLTKLPPYINAQTSLSSAVSFYATDSGATEGNYDLLAVPSRCGYSKVQGQNKITIEYVKNTGTGIVKSVIFGRAHTDSTAMVGVLLGEITQKSNYASGSASTVLEHRTDRSLLWRYKSGGADVLDLSTKEILNQSTTPEGPPAPNMSLTWAQVSTAIGSTVTAGATGGQIVNGNIYRVDYTSNIANTSVICTLSRFIVASPAAADKKEIVFPLAEGFTYDNRFLPTMVTNPANNTIEVFMPVGHGTENKTGGKTGVNLKKAVISNLTGVVTDAQISIMDLGVMTNEVPCGLTQFTSLGFYDHVEGKYYLPCPFKVDAGTGALLTIGSQAVSSGVCPGYIFDKTNMSVVGEYFAQAINTASPYIFDNGTGAISPVRTAEGIAYLGYNITNMPYYPIIGQVLSGVVLADEYEKTSDNILRIIYEYELL